MTTTVIPETEAVDAVDAVKAELPTLDHLQLLTLPSTGSTIEERPFVVPTVSAGNR